jgi:hypothetical protein
VASANNGTLKPVRCAIYTRESTEEGLNQDFNTLDAQRDAAQAYIGSQVGEGWSLCRRGTTTAATRAPTWMGQRCVASWQTPRPVESTA